MALLAPQAPSPAGTAPSYAAATGGGDTVRPGPGIYLDVKNAHTSAQTVTVVAVQQCNHGSLHNLAVAVPANTGQMEIGPIDGRFARLSDGLAEITYSGVTALTIRAITR